MLNGRDWTALLISIVVHGAALVVLAAIHRQLTNDQPVVAVETVFNEERQQEEFTQQLEVDTQVSENLSVVSGGMVSTDIGAAANTTPISRQKIEQSDKLTDPVAINVDMVDTPGLSALGEDLGEGEVHGETGAHVEGYGAAMSRVSKEVLRHMRKNQVLAVWLFDASSSLKDDRDEISRQFNKIYEELDIAREEAEQIRKERFETLETMICSFGEGVKPLMAKPSGDLKQIRDAIARVQEDTSGKENVFTAVSTIVDEYGKMALRSKRKLIVVVISDESGDDESLLEEVIVKTERAKAPVYFLGRESIFGYPYARVRRVDEETGLPVWPRITRGPETARPEALQWTGFGGRDGWSGSDSQSAGFGPYSQVRLARESGGIFFLLADVEEQLSVSSEFKNERSYDPIAMKEYEPLLLPVKEYEQRRSASEFRETMWKVIVLLNPHLDNQLNFRWRYPLDFDEFAAAGKDEFDKALRAMSLTKEAIEQLERIRPLRDKEREQRWRAAYDLLVAQTRAYRVRMFQFLLALDKHYKAQPKATDPKHNSWHRHIQQELVEPDAEQVKKTKIDLSQIQKEMEESKAAFQRVRDEHPGTPWSSRAAWELNRGYGIGFHSHFHDPRYDDPDLRPKVPNL